MSEEQKITYMIEQLQKIAKDQYPHRNGALHQLIAKQTLQEIAGG